MNQQRQLRAQVEEALAALDVQLAAVYTQVAASYYSYKAAEAALPSSEAAVESSGRAYRGYVVQYKTGTASILDVLNSLTLLSNARSQQIVTRTQWAPPWLISPLPLASSKIRAASGKSLLLKTCFNFQSEIIMSLLVNRNRLCLLLVLALCMLMCVSCKKKATQKAAPPRVATAQVKQQDVPIYIDSIGQVIPPVTVNVRPQVGGKLIKTYIQQGAIVKEGDVIYEIDPRPFQALVDEAKAQLAHDQALLEYAEQAVQRNKKVVEDEFLSLLNFEQLQSTAGAARAQVELDKAAVTYNQINLDFCKIVAPVSGKISYFNVDVGNILIIDDPNQITVIRPFSPIDITFSLPQQQFELIRRVQGDAGEWPFVATLPENPKNPFEGTTYFVDNQIDQNTGTILLKGRLKNENRALWPGEFIRVKVLHRMAPNALTVPPGAVLIGRDGPYIYLVDKEGKAVVQNVIVLTRTEEYIAIQGDNVHPGDTVITDGQINIAPGILVAEVSTNTP